MGKFCPINLSLYFNHKLIYKENPKVKGDEILGLDGRYILSNDFDVDEHPVVDGVDFLFNYGRYDNVSCDSQRIKIESNAEKLHIIGFAYWGSVNEYLKIIFDDLTYENVKVPFLDWSHNSAKTYWSDFWNIRKFSTWKTVKTSGTEKCLVNFHHIVCELKNRKRIKEIILPNNILTHIFAITLEY